MGRSESRKGSFCSVNTHGKEISFWGSEVVESARANSCEISMKNQFV